MRIRLLMLVAIVMIASACTEYSCPTYGNHYVYTPIKKKSFKSSKKAKPRKMAEQ